ncbi:MAG: hypothetical protein K0B07_04830 [DPANN group archaeon]|nr:hypothetical protein [DPANN group archaeon]
MFSKLLSFFIPKEDNFIKKDELDLLVNTVSKGFQTHRDRLVSVEQTSVQTKVLIDSLGSRISQVESVNNDVNDIRSAVLTTQGRQSSIENSIVQISENINGVRTYAKSEISELMQHISSLNARLKHMESQSFLTITDLESYHVSTKGSLDSRLDNLATDIKRQTAETISSIPQEKPQVLQKTTTIEVERDIDVSNLTHLEKSILKTLVELKVKNNVTSITITDLTNIIYPEGAMVSKRPTVSAYVSKLALSGFLKKERKNNSVFISIRKDKVIDYFTQENYSHLKRVI